MAEKREMPAAVRGVFDAVPEAHMVCEEMGHAYGRAKYQSRCPLTGVIIPPTTTYRFVRVWARDGRMLEGYASPRSLEALSFVGSGAGYVGWTSWRAPYDGWADDAAAKLEALPDGTRVQIMRGRGAYEPSVTSWTKDKLFGWMGSRHSKQSSAQLAAALRRGADSVVAFRVEEPWRSRFAPPAAE